MASANGGSLCGVDPSLWYTQHSLAKSLGISVGQLKDNYIDKGMDHVKLGDTYNIKGQWLEDFMLAQDGHA